MRSLQGKQELIPADVIEREKARYTAHRDWSQRARFFYKLGRYREAAEDYNRSILEDIQEGNLFAAAFYLKELISRNLCQELLILSLKDAAAEGNLGLQVRALEELEWTKELDEFLLANMKEIKESKDLNLNMKLAKAQGDEEQYVKLKKDLMRSIKTIGPNIVAAKATIDE